MNKYIQDKQTALFDELGVFFAFCNKQFEEKRVAGVEYCTVIGAGDCVPMHQAEEFATRLASIHQEGRDIELAEKGIGTIIEEQLANHECFYTGDVSDAFDALCGFDVTYEQVKSVYNKVSPNYAHW